MQRKMGELKPLHCKTSVINVSDSVEELITNETLKIK
jgi:hypothetical protein